MLVSNINKQNFEEEVLNSDRPVLLDFYADWCGPCRMVGPIVSEIADERNDIKVGKINVDSEPELTELDLAYAPPYSSAKDPVNMAGFIIENIKNGVVKQWYYEDTEKLKCDESVTLLDTRTPIEYTRGHIDGFINIPVDELREHIGELDKSKPVYVICQSGLRSYISSRILAGNGFCVYNFAGGFRFYDTVHNDKTLNKKSTPCGMDN